MNDELRRALALMDGTEKSDKRAQDEPGLSWSNKGHWLTLEPKYASALEGATQADLALFGDSRLMFGVAVRLINPYGSASEWSFYKDSCDYYIAHSFVPPVGNAQLVPDDEGVVTLQVLPDPGGKTIEKALLVRGDFAFALRRRVEASRDTPSKVGWLQSLSAQVDQLVAWGFEHHVFARATGDLHTITTPTTKNDGE